MLTSSQLQAFYQVAQEQSFSLAAEKLSLTQSALSQRVAKLETALGARLFHRQGQSLAMTEAGFRVFSHCQQLLQLEHELLSKLSGDRLVSFTGRYLLMVKPTLIQFYAQMALSSLMRHHPELELCFHLETQDSCEKLEREEVHYVITDRVFERPGLSSYVVGRESFAMVESAKHGSPLNTYLDLSGESSYLFSLLHREGERLPNVRRREFHDFSSLIEACRQGLGKALLPQQLINASTGLKVLVGSAVMHFPVVVNFTDHQVSTKLHTSVLELLSKQGEKVLTS